MENSATRIGFISSPSFYKATLAQGQALYSRRLRQGNDDREVRHSSGLLARTAPCQVLGGSTWKEVGIHPNINLFLHTTSKTPNRNMRHENSRASLLLGAPLFSPSLAPPWPSVAPPWPSVTSPLSVAPLWPLTFYSAPHPLPPLILSLPSPPSPNLPGPSSPASPPVVPVPKGTELDIPFRNALKFFARLSEAVCHEACDTVYRAPDSRRTRKHRTFWANGPSDYVGTNPRDPLGGSFTFRELDKPQRPLPKCSDCGKVFSTNGNRDIHKVDVHGRKTFVCEHDGCVTRLASEWRLKRHMRLVHRKNSAM
ncbi:hypothetical protein L202_06773 [Cryptococcus amylolentus CBS 6039]|uniref:C2H2-type domain-containing protein n=1 Tax=Cryptococcus amylolentus CBS 6039 TaxID=1295533 RepID=A0A1E3HG17_9TREE|nr:hypothetical protein L202_06773 [Cryptococcus amylolentus CBS 6039]ODN74361.1 hypothetical protein L202_06773 [Cryptococcus amylolentus CBS 6039]